MDLDRVVVLAGGGSVRLGRDKLGADLAGSSVLDRLLDGLALHATGVPIVAVGPTRATRTPVRWCREHPAGGGPVAAIAAGLANTAALANTAGLANTADLADPAVLAVVAGDLPFAAGALPELFTALHEAGTGTDAAIGVDGTGRDQLLLGVHRCGPLRAAVGLRPQGQSVRAVVSRLTVVRVPLPASLTLDVDTAADLDAARAAAERDVPARGEP